MSSLTRILEMVKRERKHPASQWRSWQIIAVSTSSFGGSGLVFALIPPFSIDALKIGGIVSAAAGAWTGAMAGAAIGTVVPGVGNIVGAIGGFVVGFAVSFGVQHLWDRYVKQPVTEFISNGISAWSGVVQNGLVIARTAANRVTEGVRQTVDRAATAVKETAGEITNTVATAANTVSNAVTTAANAVSDAVGTAANAVSNAVSSVASFFGFGGG